MRGHHEPGDENEDPSDEIRMTLPGEMLVSHRINSIPDHNQDVEPEYVNDENIHNKKSSSSLPGEDRLGEVDILRESHGGVVAASDGVGCGDYRAPGRRGY